MKQNKKAIARIMAYPEFSDGLLNIINNLFG